MRFSYLFVFFILLSGSFDLLAQTSPNFCGTAGKSPWLIEYQKNRAANPESADTTWLYVPITFHMVGTDAGYYGYGTHQVFAALCNLNKQFEQVHVKFYLHPTLPFNYLANSSWNNHDWAGGSDLIQTNNIDDRLNAYLVNDPAGNCGYSWQDAIVLSKGCSGPTNATWAHEVGHHLSLPHPFYGWEGRNVDPTKPAPEQLGVNDEVEKVARVNCLTAGDGFCDTEADYISYRWTCTDGKSYQMLDPDSVAFRADGTYIMGYANDNCQNRFMPDQIEAMRANLRTQHSQYLVLNQPQPGIANGDAIQLNSPIDTALVQFNNATFTWNPLPGAEYYFLQVGLFESLHPIVHSANTTDTNYSITTGLPKNRKLYWRVKAYNAWDACNDENNYQVGVFYSLDLSAANDLEKSLGVSVAPNPVIAGLPLNLQVEGDQSEDVKIQIYDMNSRLIYQAQSQLVQGEQNIEIPTSALVTGQYRLTLHNERGIISRTFAVFE
jgi:hypothetical protein